MKQADVKNCLIEQLKLKGADIAVFTDMVSDYLTLWKTKNQLAKDIKDRGVTVKTYNSSGIGITKENPSVKNYVNVNKEMLFLLEKMNIKTDSVYTESGENDDL